MAINLDVILKHVGESLEEFSNNVEIPQELLLKYANGEEKPKIDVLAKIRDYTDLPFDKIDSTQVRNEFGVKIEISDTWAPSEKAKSDLKTYIEEGVSFSTEDVKNEILKIRKCIDNWRKPKITFAGQSDTGKSTIINELIGSEKVPAKWTPTTAIATYIKHISDRPSYIKDDVWIFGKKGDEQWDETRLSDEAYTKEFLITGGDISLLEKYGIHQTEGNRPREAYSAVVFVDADLLKDCDIVDLPGFAANEEDDKLHEGNTKRSQIDVLVYLSRANGFLQDRDLDYLNVCLDSLNPMEKGEGVVPKLGNLFIVATHANTVNNGNAEDLRAILDTQASSLSKMLRQSANIAYPSSSSILPRRSENTGVDYDENDLRLRFFTYDKAIGRLNKKFYAGLKTSLEQIPKQLHMTFHTGLRKIADDSKSTLKERITEYTAMVEDTEKYLKLAKELKAKEPARVAEQNALKDELMSKIDNYCIETKQEVRTMFTTYMCEDNLISEMERLDCKNKKSEKENFVSAINRIINDKVQSIIDDKSALYSKDLDSFLSAYNEKIGSAGSVEGIDTKFDATKAFVTGISALSAVGAAGAWLASSFVAEIVVLFPELASVGMFAAFGGVITIGIAAAIAGAVALIKALTWKKSLAKEIIKGYKEKNYENMIMEKVDEYWQETKNSLDVGCSQIEKEWKAKIMSYEVLADEDDIKKRIQMIEDLTSGLSFFEQMPMPEIG